MYVIFNGFKFVSSCYTMRDDLMLCETPVFPNERNIYKVDTTTTSILLDYRFILDTVIYTPPNNTKNEYPFLLFPNPYFAPFVEEVKKYRGDYLKMQGQDLNLVATKDDFVVWIGNEICNITALSYQQLACNPLSHQPCACDMDDKGQINPVAFPTVRVGKLLTYDVGCLQYEYKLIDDPLFLSGVIVGGIILIVLVAVIVVLVFRNNKLRRDVLEEFINGSVCIAEEEVETATNMLKLPYNQSLELKEDDFSINWSAVLGEGAFGKVFKGAVNLNGIEKEVAFKVPSSSCSFIDFKNLLCEIKVMSYVGRHEHVLSIVGAYTAKLHKGVVYIATNLCEGGSSETHLRKKKKTFHCDLEVSQLYKWLYQIASGMAYLGSRNVVHRDLATRNVLLTFDYSAKISDFGLSRRMYDITIYKMAGQERLPYVNVNSKMYDYDLMTQCWTCSVADRISFKSLEEALQVIYNANDRENYEDVGISPYVAY